MSESEPLVFGVNSRKQGKTGDTLTYTLKVYVSVGEYSKWIFQGKIGGKIYDAFSPFISESSG